jgi:hypothetical protein
MSKTPPLPEELWQALLDFAADEDIEEIMAMTDAMLNDELRAAGIDPIAAGKQGVTVVNRALVGEEPTGDELAPTSARNPFSTRPPPPLVAEAVPAEEPPVSLLAFRRADDEAPASRRVFYVAGLLVAAASAAFFLLRQPEPHDDPGPDPIASVTPEESAPLPLLPEKSAAATLRGEADKQCGAHDWAACLTSLDHAKDLDPAGDTAPAVAKERAEAKAGIAGASKAPEGKGPK